MSALAKTPGVKEVVPSSGDLSPEVLYARYAGPVFARCRYLLRGQAEAEDATQEVFARVLAHLDGFRSEASPLTWLITIATRHCLNALRGKGAAWHAQYAAREQARGEASADAPDARELVRQILSRFDEETQVAAVCGVGAAAHAVRRFAVIVGNDRGGDGTRPLHYAEDDARRMFDILVRLGGVLPEDAQLLLGRRWRAWSAAGARRPRAVSARRWSSTTRATPSVASRGWATRGSRWARSDSGCWRARSTCGSRCSTRAGRARSPG